MKFIRLLVLLCGFLCGFTFADDVGELNQLLQSFHSMSANFTQNITDNQGNQSMATGSLIIQKPNQFRWEEVSPNEQLFISDGKKLWNVEPDLEQVTVSALSQNLSTTPLLLLSGNVDDVNKLFSVKVLNANQYALTPHDQDALIKNVVLSFNQGKISSISIVNTLGQTATVSFSQVVFNVPVSAQTFTYTPAPGFDVLNQ